MRVSASVDNREQNRRCNSGRAESPPANFLRGKAGFPQVETLAQLHDDARYNALQQVLCLVETFPECSDSGLENTFEDHSWR
jgi:hypothetical protein